MRWLAWYSGRRLFSGGRHDWRALAPEGCVGVVELAPATIHAGEWHWTEGGRVRSIPGALPGVVTPPPPGVSSDLLKRGATIPDAEWEAVRAEMNRAAGL